MLDNMSNFFIAGGYQDRNNYLLENINQTVIEDATSKKTAENITMPESSSNKLIIPWNNQTKNYLVEEFTYSKFTKSYQQDKLNGLLEKMKEEVVFYNYPKIYQTSRNKTIMSIMVFWGMFIFIVCCFIANQIVTQYATNNRIFDTVFGMALFLTLLGLITISYGQLKINKWSLGKKLASRNDMIQEHLKAVNMEVLSLVDLEVRLGKFGGWLELIKTCVSDRFVSVNSSMIGNSVDL